MRGLFIPHTSPDGLRAIDRVIRDILWRYPEAPRPIDDPWYPMHNRLFVLGLTGSLLVTALVIYILSSLVYMLHTGNIWRSRYIAALFSPLLVGVFIYYTFYPFYAWWVGIRSGKPTIAIVQKITERPDTNGVRGTWEVFIDSQWIALTFRQNTYEEQTWIQNVCEGDRIQVLVHPKKPKVLLAYGP